MIFVTVGTHEQQFNRLVEAVDKWAASHDEKVFIQTGYSTYEPKHCEWKKFLPYKEMSSKIEEARIVITHGGPSSFIAPIQIGKVPIVVPRQKDFDEHVNNHQLDFCRQVSERMGTIILVEDVDKLSDTIERYDEIVEGMNRDSKSNNQKFCEGLANNVIEILRG